MGKNILTKKKVIEAALLIGFAAVVLLVGRMQNRGTQNQETEAAGTETGIETGIETESETEEELLEREMAEIADANTVTFRNPFLEKAVKNQLGEDTPLSREQIANLEELLVVVDDSIESNCIFYEEDLALFEQLTTLSIENTSGLINGKVKIIYGYRNLEVLPNLENLMIYDESFRHLSSISGLTNLTTLSLVACSVDRLDSIQSLTNLECLSLNGMYLYSLSPLLSLNKLTILDLSYSRFENYQSVIGQLDKLEYLGLERCYLKEIDFIGNLKNLKRLELANNKLTNIDVVSELPELSILQVKDNPLEGPLPIGEMENLVVFGCDAAQQPDISAAEQIPLLELDTEDYLEEYSMERKAAEQVYRPQDDLEENQKLKMEICCAGDFNQDGIMDWGMVVKIDSGVSDNAMESRLFYLYPGNGTSYDMPLKPLELDSSANCTGILMGDGKLLIQESKADTKTTDIYTYQKGKWTCIRQNELSGYENYYYDNYDYITRDYQKQKAVQYVIMTTSPGFCKVKVAEDKQDADNPRISDISVVEEVYAFHYTPDWAMRRVLLDCFPNGEAEKIYEDENEYTENLVLLDGIIRPTYEYLVHDGEEEYRIAFSSYNCESHICTICVSNENNTQTGYGTKIFYEYDLKYGKINTDSNTDSNADTQVRISNPNQSDVMEYQCVQRALAASDLSEKVLRTNGGRVAGVYTDSNGNTNILCLVIDWSGNQDSSYEGQRILYTYVREGTTFKPILQEIVLKGNRQENDREEVFIEDGTLYLKYHTSDGADEYYRNRIFQFSNQIWEAQEVQELHHYTGYISAGYELSSQYIWKRDSSQADLCFTDLGVKEWVLGDTDSSYLVMDDSVQLIDADAPYICNPYPELPDFGYADMYATYDTVKENTISPEEALDIVACRLFDWRDLKSCAYQTDVLKNWRTLLGIEIPDYYFEVETGEESALFKYCRESNEGYIFALVSGNQPAVYYEYNVEKDIVYKLSGEDGDADE
jgi:hypothetical protein